MVGVSLKTSSTTLVIFFPVITVSFISDMATCQQCQQTFGRTNSLTRHLREKHGQNQIRTECQFCTKTFARPEHYHRHLQTQHNEAFALATYPCPARLPKQDLQAQRLPTKTPAKLPYLSKDHQSRRTVCNAFFPTRGH